jgi:glutamate-ammonia-ligase adenylyltransferase
MERELADEAPEHGRYDIKAGRGGLVDIEFLTQYLQLVHGPRLPSVRARATAPALDAVHAAGLLADAEHAQLTASWRFLRRLENRLRIVHDRPIARLRADSEEGSGQGAPHGAELDKLARRLGHHGAAPGARLLDEYREHTERVRAIYARRLG